MKQKSVNQIVNDLLVSQETVTNREIAAQAKVSRQAVHGHLRNLVESGKLIIEGAGRSVSAQKEKTLASLFHEFTEDFKFTRTHQVVKLLERGIRFVSRSEAKRLCAGLERFSTVTLDFRGVEGVGQGFADEVFRVWATSHSDTQLVATNMNPAVEFMIRRAGYHAPE